MTIGMQVGTQMARGRVLEVTKCALIVLSGPRQGLEKVIEGDVFRVGKAGENDLVLDHETVSRCHCELCFLGRSNSFPTGEIASSH